MLHLVDAALQPAPAPHHPTTTTHYFMPALDSLSPGTTFGDTLKHLII